MRGFSIRVLSSVMETYIQIFIEYPQCVLVGVKLGGSENEIHSALNLMGK